MSFRGFGVAAGDHAIVDPEAGEPVPGCRVVVATVEVQCFDIGEEPDGGDRVEGGFQEVDVVRFAPSMTHPVGMPCASTAMDHFQPSLALSVGFGQVPSPP